MPNVTPPWGATFPGDGTYLMTNGEVANMPGSSPYGFLAYCYKNPGFYQLQPFIGGAVGILLQNVADQYFDNSVWSVNIANNGNDPSQGFFHYITFSDGPNYNAYASFIMANPAPVDGACHLMLLAWDTSQGIVTGSIDGQPQTWLGAGGSVTTQDGTKFQPQAAGGPFSVGYGYPWAIGGPLDSNHTSTFAADLFDFRLLASPQFIDASDPNVIARFWDFNNNVPLRCDGNGGDAFEDLGLRFQICLSGDSDRFNYNLTNDSPYSGIGTGIPDPNNIFQIVGGEGLAPPPVDPWGNTP